MIKIKKKEKTMKKFILTAIFIIMALSLSAYSYDGIINIAEGEDGVVLESYTLQNIHLKAKVSDIAYRIHIREGKIYTEIYIPDESVYGEYGDPQLPVFYKLIQIPEFADFKLSFKLGKAFEVDMLAETGAEYLYPVQLPVRKTPEEISFMHNKESYSVDAYLPDSIVIANEEIRARGRRILPVTIFPVRYNPVSQRLIVYSEIDIGIELIDVNKADTGQMIGRYTSSFSDMYDEIVIGSSELKLLSGSKGFNDEGILIITADALHSGLSSFVQWKEKKGYRVTLIQQSDIASGSTTTGIKNYIQNAYNTWDIPPSSVILVGDSDTIPTYSGGSSGTAADVYYVYLEGSDYFPDAGISRIAVRTLTQLATYMNKLLYYEQYGNPNLAWMNDAALISGEDYNYYHIGEGTLNYIASTYLDPFNWTYDKLYRHTYNASKAEVISSLNAGKAVANYTAHCDTTSWDFRSGQYITNSDVHALNNTNMYFFAVGNCCLSGKFNTVNECIGEAFIRANNGAIAYWGASNYSYWGEDDILAKKSFEGFFVQKLHKLDQNVNYAKIALWNHYSGGGMSRYYMDMYNLFGDGTTFMPTTMPANPVVIAPDTMPAGSASINVNVSLGGSPYEGVLVSAYNPDIGIRGASKTDASGFANIVFDSPLPASGSFLLVVTHPNIINYEKTIIIGDSLGGIVYRFFNTVRGGHLYTISDIERDYIIQNLPEWTYEGPKFMVYEIQEAGSTATYRFFNTITGIHLYTISEYERDIVMQLPEWNYEGIKFYVHPDHAVSTVPVYRFFNHVKGGHLFTISEYERDVVMQLPEWTYEGIPFYVFPLPQNIHIQD